MTDISHLANETGEVPLHAEQHRANTPIPHGPCVAHREDGTLRMEITYDHGTAHGPYCDYWSNGVLAFEGQFADGKQEGEWRYYDRDGNLQQVLSFRGGQVVNVTHSLPR